MYGHHLDAPDHALPKTKAGKAQWPWF